MCSSYDMHAVESLLLEFALGFSLFLPLLQLVVPIMLVLWCCSRSIVLSLKRSSILGSNRIGNTNERAKYKT